MNCLFQYLSSHNIIVANCVLNIMTVSRCFTSFYLPLQHPPSESRVSEASTSDDEDQRKNDEDSAEAKEFYSRLKKFHEARGTPIQRQQSMGPQNVSLFQLYQRVAIVGGMDRVTQEMKWRSVHLQLGMPSLPTTQSLRQIYKK